MSPADREFLYVDLAVLLCVLGALLLWAGWAGRTGRLKRNYVIGTRTSAIMRSDETWRVAHKKSAWSFWGSGCVLLGAGVVIMGLRPPERWSVAIMTGAGLSVFAMTIAGAVQAARTVDHEAPRQ